MSALPPYGRIRLRFAAGLWLLLMCLSVGLIIFFTGAPPASASINLLFASPTPTQENLWAYVDMAKPTATIPPIVLPADTPISPVATETPGAVVIEFVDDSTVPTQVVEGPEAPSLPEYGESKYILVDISEQHMYVYEGDALIYSFVASTGINNATRVGTFAVQSKIPNAYGSTWNIWMPSWLGIYWAGGLENGIHALPILPNGAILWEGYLGSPVSYGCVVLGTNEAQLLYDWAEIGTPVEIQW